MAFRSTLRSGMVVCSVRKVAKETRQANCLITETSVCERGDLKRVRIHPDTNDARVSAKYPGQFYRRDDEDRNSNSKGVCRSRQFVLCCALLGGRCGGNRREICFA